MRIANAAVWLWLIATSGCLHEVRPDPKALTAAPQLLPLRVKYYLPPGETDRVYRDRFFNLGIVHTWTVDIGETLGQSFPRMLQGVFASVKPANGANDVADADVFISPVITGFETDGGSFISTFRLRLLVLDADRKVVLEELLTATPTQDQSEAAWGGVFTGATTLQTSAEHSFELMMSRIARRLQDALTHARAMTPVGV